MWLFGILAVLLAFAQTDEPASATGWLRLTLDHDGLTRDYSVYVPQTLLDPVPLVIALHPYGTGGAQMALITRFNELADASGVIVAYPEGPGGYWDYGAGLPAWDVIPDVRDDLGFIAAMIEEIDRAWTLDRSRIYAVGYSNGARMAYRLACELPLAAAAMVAATVGDEVTEACSEDVVPVWIQHGTLDQVIPFEGDPDVMFDDLRIGRALSVIETAQFFARRNGCENPTMETLHSPTELSTLAEMSAIAVSRVQYQNCANGTTVDVVVADGGGHTWSHVNAVDTSALIWEFLGSNARVPDSEPTETPDE
jgi:polyhydroxybutyrate depolymerase